MSKSLPPHPSLEALKKQAKQLVAAHKSGDASACETLRLLKRFADASDAEILSAKVSLTAAQFALAMDYGFESWAVLKAHVETVAGEKVMSAVVYGRVTSEATGESIEGVEVRFDVPGSSKLLTGDRVVFTDADGRYECRLQWRGDGRPELCYQCCHAAYVCVGGWETEPGPEPKRRLQLADGERYEIDVSLKEGYTLELTVQNERGEPVAGAEIITYPWGGGGGLDALDGMGYNHQDPAGWPKTDSAGRCRIEGLDAHLPADYRCPVKICHDDYRDHIISDASALPREGHVAPAQASLPIGLCFSGRAICAQTGRPVAGATIYANPSKADVAGSDINDTRGSSGVTGPDGSFRIPGLRACRHDITVISEGWVWNRMKEVTTDPDQPLDIQMERGRVITGEVIGRDGQPAAKARIDAYGPGIDRDRWENRIEADESGRFEIGGLPAGVPLCLTADHHELCGVRELGPEESHVVFDARELVDLDGMVVDEAGQAVPARVLCTVGMEWMQEGISLGMLPVLDADGVFRARVPADGPVKLYLRSSEDLTGSQFYNQEVLTMHDGRPDRSLTFKANPPCKLALKFLDAQTGQPVSDLWIRLDTSVCLINIATDDQGRAVFENLPRHDAKLSASAPGYEDVRGERIALPTDEEIVIRLTPETKTSAT